MNVRAWVAEFIGTFALIFVGAGAIAAAGVSDSNLVGIALAHGLTIAVMVSATMAISGGHLNPAVTIGLLVTGRVGGVDAIGYIVAQCLGAISAAGALVALMPDAIRAVGVGTPALAEGVGAGSGLVLEAILTFFLMFVIFGTAVDRRAPKVGGLFIGLTVALDILIGGPFTGAAMNPARHLGPAMYAGAEALSQVWLYWLGPVLGAVAAALVYAGILEQRKGDGQG